MKKVVLALTLTAMVVGVTACGLDFGDVGTSSLKEEWNKTVERGKEVAGDITEKGEKFYNDNKEVIDDAKEKLEDGKKTIEKKAKELEKQNKKNKKKNSKKKSKKKSKK